MRLLTIALSLTLIFLTMSTSITAGTDFLIYIKL